MFIFVSRGKHLYERFTCRSTSIVFLHFRDRDFPIRARKRHNRRLLYMATITLLAMIRYTRIVNSNDCQCIFTYVCTNPMLLLPSMILFFFYFLFRYEAFLLFYNLASISPRVSRLLRAENTFTDRHLNMYVIVVYRSTL